MRHSIITYCAAGALALASCSPSVPKSAQMAANQPLTYPDFADATVPCNIAPLNFKINESGSEFVTHVHSRNAEGFVVGGKKAQMPVEKWHSLLAQAQGDSIYIDVYAKADGQWVQYQPVKIAVAEEIDPYISYRLIEPSYVNFELMRIRQRCIENFDEGDIYNNCPYAGEEQTGQCINCHNYQNYNRDGNWQMHVRITNGGTLIANKDGVKKVNLKLPETISAGVYPAWHPQLPIIAYSNNNTTQIFHYSDPNKIEVQDSASDLILYDTERGEVRFIANDSTEWETFPAWSPDGKYLYYVSAKVPAMDENENSIYRKYNYKDIKYDIYRRAFDAQNYSFSAPDTVYRASEQGQSAILPRISPDGRYLLFAQAEYGTFHIWHHDADLYVLDLLTGEVAPLVEANSPDTESYHSWSSNGRWILFSSRRDDGDFTRLYMTYFDEDGRAHKPFMLPQEDPDQNTWLYKSYNVPEFMVKPVEIDRNAIIEALGKDAEQSKLVK